MPQKRKNHQSKLDKGAATLRALDEKTMKQARPLLGGNWRDNLFEILMTRFELAAKDKAFLATLPAALARDPARLPEFVQLGAATMKNILTLAKAPATPLHVAGFGVLYAHTVRAFVKDDTRDLSKTMAALDHALGLFEKFCGYVTCK